MAQTPPLFTIGYEQATVGAVMDALAEAGVELVADVRAVSASRRPGFSKRQLAAELDERGIAYLHLRGLGTPKEGREAARTGKLDALFRIYNAHLATPQAREEFDALAHLITSGRKICLLCYERDPGHCHRLRLTELMHERFGTRIEHLFAAPI